MPTWGPLKQWFKDNGYYVKMHFHLTGWDETLFAQAGEAGVLEPWNRSRSSPPGRPDPVDPAHTPSTTVLTYSDVVQESHCVHP